MGIALSGDGGVDIAEDVIKFALSLMLFFIYEILKISFHCRDDRRRPALT